MKIAQIFCGPDRFDIVGENTCSLNGVPITGEKIASELFPSIVGTLILSTCNAPENEIKIKKGPTHQDFLKGLIDTLSKSDQVKIQVLDAKPDELVNNKPIEAFTIKAIDEFRDKIKMYASCFDDTLSLTEVLLKTKLPKSIHGFKEIDNIFIKTKNAAENIVQNMEKHDIVTEQLDTKIGQVLLVLSNNMTGPSGRKILKSASNQVVENFNSMKKTYFNMICSFNSLYNVNQVFKKYTGYPATWYFDPSVFYSFTERYKDSSDHLIDMTRAEASLINPIYTKFGGI
jgi:hypothetical protein